MLTQGRAINNARVICGVYGNGSDGSSHGFFLAHRAFTEYDVPGVVDTFLLGINDAGDFAGSISDPTFQDGFVSLGGTITAFAVPGASATIANNINASNQTQGFYVDAADDTVHGYLRDSDGTLTFPIDPDGAMETVLFGNNDANWIVGRYTDASGITHGLFFITPGEYVTFDFPGSAFTSLNGINQQGYICGRYVDDSGGQHGFLARVNPNGTSEPNKTNTLPVKAIKPSGRLLKEQESERPPSKSGFDSSDNTGRQTAPGAGQAVEPGRVLPRGSKLFVVLLFRGFVIKTKISPISSWRDAKAVAKSAAKGVGALETDGSRRWHRSRDSRRSNAGALHPAGGPARRRRAIGRKPP